MALGFPLFLLFLLLAIVVFVGAIALLIGGIILAVKGIKTIRQGKAYGKPVGLSEYFLVALGIVMFSIPACIGIDFMSLSITLPGTTFADKWRTNRTILTDYGILSECMSPMLKYMDNDRDKLRSCFAKKKQNEYLDNELAFLYDCFPTGLSDYDEINIHVDSSEYSKDKQSFTGHADVKYNKQLYTVEISAVYIDKDHPENIGIHELWVRKDGSYGTDNTKGDRHCGLRHAGYIETRMIDGSPRYFVPERKYMTREQIISDMGNHITRDEFKEKYGTSQTDVKEIYGYYELSSNDGEPEYLYVEKNMFPKDSYICDKFGNVSVRFTADGRAEYYDK